MLSFRFDVGSFRRVRLHLLEHISSVKYRLVHLWYISIRKSQHTLLCVAAFNGSTSSLAGGRVSSSAFAAEFVGSSARTALKSTLGLRNRYSELGSNMSLGSQHYERQ
jgi:hypothetical protein